MHIRLKANLSYTRPCIRMNERGERMEGGRKRKRGRDAGRCFQLTAFLESQPGLVLHLWHCLFFYVIPFSEAQISLIKMILEIVPDSCHLKA